MATVDIRKVRCIMEPITTITSTSIPIMKDNIDTDQLIQQFLKNILKVGWPSPVLWLALQ